MIDVVNDGRCWWKLWHWGQESKFTVSDFSWIKRLGPQKLEVSHFESLRHMFEDLVDCLGPRNFLQSDSFCLVTWHLWAPFWACCRQANSARDCNSVKTQAAQQNSRSFFPERWQTPWKKVAVYAFELFVGSSLLGFLPAEAWIHCLPLRHRPARSVRSIRDIFAAFIFFMVAVADCMINLVGKAGSTQDGEELQSRRSVECGTCQTVRKRMRLHLSTWLNLMSSILWGTPLPHRGPGCCVSLRARFKMVSGDLTNNLATGIGQSLQVVSAAALFALSGHGNLRLRFEETLPDGGGPGWQRFWVTGKSFDFVMSADECLGWLSTKDVSLTPLHINTLLYNLLVGMKYLGWKLPGLWVRATFCRLEWWI